MNLIIIGDAIFTPLSKDYLVYVCKKDEIEDLTIREVKELVREAMALAIKKEVSSTIH